MKLNLEIRPKEWLLVALFIVVMYLTFHGNIDEAIAVLRRWSLLK